MCGTNQHLIHCGGEESYEMPSRGRDVLIALIDFQQQWVPAQNQISQNDSIDGGECNSTITKQNKQQMYP